MFLPLTPFAGGWGGVFGRRRHLGIKLKQLFQLPGIVLEAATDFIVRSLREYTLVNACSINASE